MLTGETPQHENKNVLVAGWVSTRRDHGKIIFIDLRDRSGILQLVFSPKNERLYKIGGDLRPEWVIEVEGVVKKRPEGMANNNIATGEVELEVTSIKILSEAKALPFPIDTDGYDINEELRLRYRYLDLRRARMKKNLTIRRDVQYYIRDFLGKREFLEVETPLLSKSTPEGARDFIVPSRMHPGKFYALPQSPQQYKQLLMVAGVERYFQFARCFRDEDTRADRALEFTQLDIEVSFMSQEEILNFVEELITGVSENVVGKKIQEKPFPRLTHEEAVQQYKTENPDLRKDKNDADTLSYVWIVDFPMFEKKDDGTLGAAHHPFTMPRDEDLPLLDDAKRLLEIKAKQYDLILNGHEVFGGSVRTTNPKILAKVFGVLGHTEEEIQVKFGHLLEAFEYGVPPHGGIAASDRWLQVMLGENSIREVIPLPTTGKGITAIMEAPSVVDPKQLKELGIKIV